MFPVPKLPLFELFESQTDNSNITFVLSHIMKSLLLADIVLEHAPHFPSHAHAHKYTQQRTERHSHSAVTHFKRAGNTWLADMNDSFAAFLPDFDQDISPKVR